jgi:5-methyltetrahydrofolate--homocysteine methyltransferase
MADPAEIALAVRACREVGGGDTIVLATATFGLALGGVYRTIMGASPRDCVEAALEAGADVVGANCGTSLAPGDYLALARELVEAAGAVPVIVQPNAGAPRDEAGQIAYDATPQGMAELAGRLCSAGVRVVGGCCGTSPAHLAVMRAAVR